MAPPPFKLGTLSASGDAQEHRHEGVWELQKTTGPDRLVIAPSGGHVALLIDMMRATPGPFGLLYVLLVSRRGREPGRYQSPRPTNFDETERFLLENRDFFEHDGRHHLWVMGLTDDSTLVYDNHDLIYAYGSLARYAMVLDSHRLHRGKAEIPAPHTHMYNASYDEAEDRVMNWWEWQHFPLGPDDDP